MVTLLRPQILSNLIDSKATDLRSIDIYVLYNYLMLVQQLIILINARISQDIHGALSLQENKRLD